jgi:hypothetical protein
MGASKVSVGFPGVAAVEWSPDEGERSAAWELYVELSTRAGVWQGVPPDDGSVRELVASLHSLFREIRSILRAHATALSKPNAMLGQMGISILGGRLREFLTKWHPHLTDHEFRRPEANSPMEWERGWVSRDALLQEFDELRGELQLYADALKILF